MWSAQGQALSAPRGGASRSLGGPPQSVGAWPCRWLGPDTDDPDDADDIAKQAHMVLPVARCVAGTVQAPAQAAVPACRQL